MQDVFYIDRSPMALDPHPKSRKGKDGRTLRRKPSGVNGICVHQTAVEYSGIGWERKGHPQLEAYLRRLQFGTPSHYKARNGRTFGGIGVHVVCGLLPWNRRPFVLQLAPVSWFMHSANALNASTVSLEVVGRFPGLERRRSSKHTPASPALGAAIDAGFEYLVSRARAEDQGLRYALAHRQSSATRRSDPGEYIWNRCAESFERLDLEPMPEETWWRPKGRTGRPLPVGWAHGVARY